MKGSAILSAFLVTARGSQPSRICQSPAPMENTVLLCVRINSQNASTLCTNGKFDTFPPMSHAKLEFPSSSEHVRTFRARAFEIRTDKQLLRSHEAKLLLDWYDSVRAKLLNSEPCCSCFIVPGRSNVLTRHIRRCSLESPVCRQSASRCADN